MSIKTIGDGAKIMSETQIKSGTYAAAYMARFGSLSNKLKKLKMQLNLKARVATA